MNKQHYEERIENAERRRESIRRAAEKMLLTAQEVRGGTSPLTMGENQRLRAMQNDLADLDIELRELAEDRDRCEIPEKYQNLGRGQHGMVGSAGRLAPLHFGDH
jgi:hypothetical protein